MAARRLFHSLPSSIVTAKCLGATAGTPDLSDWISAISGAMCLKLAQVMAGQVPVMLLVRCENAGDWKSFVTAQFPSRRSGVQLRGRSTQN